ncbi:MAG: DUF362 domain-containing protein [Candidatus Thorarchaeota archaeon]|nr:DUF362 domain-containing protein [Candidatus Thorarchaeota archaeon]
MDYTAEVAVGIARNQREALSNALKKLSSPPVLTSKQNQVVLKPSIYDTNLPDNTSFELIRAIVRTFSLVGQVHIVEDDNPLRTADIAFSESGYAQLADKNVILVNLSRTQSKHVQKTGLIRGGYDLPRLILQDRFFINVPTLKIDPRVTIGAGIKNLFGLIPEKNKDALHEQLEDILLDLLSIVAPDLTILDLTDVVIGSREDEKTVHVGGVLVGTDPVAVDALAASLLGRDPLNISLLRRAHDMGLGEALPDRIRLVGTEHQKEILYDSMERIRNASD